MGFNLTSQETNTIMAALRCYQGMINVDPDADPFDDIATNGGKEKPLTVKEIDDLCEKINMTDDWQTTRVFYHRKFDDGSEQCCSCVFDNTDKKLYDVNIYYRCSPAIKVVDEYIVLPNGKELRAADGVNFEW